MPRFGQYLIKSGLLTSEQLEEALQHQAVYGARLGTNLVELAMLNVEQLAECLSEFHRVPLPPRPLLERPRRAAIKRVTRPLVERIRFIPLRLDNNVLHAAVMDPNDPGVLDNLRFATGCKIQPYVLPEIWMHDWLFTLFKMPRGIRHIETESSSSRVSDKPEQGYDFQAAQAAQAAQVAQVAQARKAARAQPTDSLPTQAAVVIDPKPSAAPAQKSRQTLSGEERTSAPVAAGASMPQPISKAPLSARASAPSPAALVGGAVAAPALAPKQASKSPLDPGTSSVAAALLAQPAVERSPVAAAPAGASVRPPPVPLQSLADLAGLNLRLAVPAMPVQAVTLSDYEPPPFAEAELGWDEPLRSQRPSEAPEVTIENEREPSRPIVVVSPTPKPAAITVTLSELEESLKQVTDREQLIELSLSIANRFAPNVALFIVHRGTVQGVRCIAANEARAIDGILVPLEAATSLSQAASATQAFRADPRERTLDARVQQLLADEAAREIGLFPVAIKQRVVNLLYASNGGEPLGTIAFAALGLLCEQMAAAYGQLIMQRKGTSAAS